jgi:Flp pilus assembly pilin Flp
MSKVLQTLWSNQQGQDIAEYAVMLAVILVIVVGTIRLVGAMPTRCSLRWRVQFSKNMPV